MKVKLICNEVKHARFYARTGKPSRAVRFIGVTQMGDFLRWSRRREPEPARVLCRGGLRFCRIARQAEFPCRKLLKNRKYYDILKVPNKTKKGDK